MSELSKFSGRTKVFKINGIEMNIKPFKAKDMALLLRLEKQKDNEEKFAESMMELLKRVLKDSFPDATDEEVENFGLDNIEELMEAIKQVNGFKN